MGFVTKLLSIFVPLIAVMIFHFQRDHILDEKQNEFLDEKFTMISEQFNRHLDSIVEQLNLFVSEQKEIVGTANDEVKLKEENIAKKAENVAVTKEPVKESVQATTEKPTTEKVTNTPIKLAKRSESSRKCDLGNDLLITKEQLKQYNGEDPKKKIYLAFLGIVYDVSKGETHYSPGGSYSMFTAKDASRAFITGDFSEAGLTDDLTGIKTDSFNGVKEWSDFYEKSYRRVGRLVGAFYDQNGCPTEQVRFVEEQLEKAASDNLDDQYENELYPPCNMEFDQKKKETKFSCTKLSGGIKREWVGVPRQLFSLKNKKDFRCACVRDFGPETKVSIEYADEGEDEPRQEEYVGDLKNPRVREFEGCPAKATECVVKNK